MKKLFILFTLLTTNTLMAQMNSSSASANSNDSTLITCHSFGSGLRKLDITFSSTDKLNMLKKGVIIAKGFSLYRFEVQISNLNIQDDQMSFDFSGKDISGSYEVNLENKLPKGDGIIDLDIVPNVGVRVFNKYLLSNCTSLLSQ